MTRITKYFSSSRGIRNLVFRIGSVLRRFGLGSKRFEKDLNEYSTITKNLNCRPTFSIPAIILKRNPEMIKRLSRKGVEFIVHGYIHIDYKLLSSEEQTKHFSKAMDTFRNFQIPYKGFRAPYLRISKETPVVLNNLKFLYDSSSVMNWNVIEQNRYPKHVWTEYGRLLDFYQSQSAQDYLVLPSIIDGLVEIPVSMPDDEAMIDRLGIRDGEEISRVWQAILSMTYERGELFTIQLHPERFSLCKSALVRVIKRAKTLNPSVWIASLGEIADWWKEKDKFSLEVQPEGNGRYRVKASCPEQATLLLRNCKTTVTTAEWSYGYQSTSARDFIIESPKRPIIGVEPSSSQKAVDFLKSEGYVIERGKQPDNYGIYLDNLTDFQGSDEKPLSKRIESSNSPLLRYWRWPYFAKSALAITGDIDALNLLDFVLRLSETWRQNGK
jgi:peptidoglycan/xylan/chitin deacetylase (PgdA/CDA1 family)